MDVQLEERKGEDRRQVLDRVCLTTTCLSHDHHRHPCTETEVDRKHLKDIIDRQNKGGKDVSAFLMAVQATQVPPTSCCGIKIRTAGIIRHSCDVQ